jgi:polar amino acid transport system substrate-binding protein
MSAKLKLVFLCLILLYPYAFAQQNSLRFLAPDVATMPEGRIIKTANNKIYSEGYVPDFENALAAALGLKAVHVMLSRKRMELPEILSSIDVACFASPAWRGSSADLYDWVKLPLMNIDHVLVGDKNMPPITKQSDLIGKHIGTLLGYRYPEIEYLFEKKLAYREDAPTHDSAILKQKLKRTDYTIVRQTQFRYLQKIDVNFANLMASPLIVSSTPVYCARIKTSQLSQERFEAALHQLAKEKTLERLLAKYLPHD